VYPNENPEIGNTIGNKKTVMCLVSFRRRRRRRTDKTDDVISFTTIGCGLL